MSCCCRGLFTHGQAHGVDFATRVSPISACAVRLHGANFLIAPCVTDVGANVGFQVIESLVCGKPNLLDSLKASIGLLDMAIERFKMIRDLHQLLTKGLLAHNMFLNCVNTFTLFKECLAEFSDNTLKAAESYSPVTQPIIKRCPSLLKEFMFLIGVTCSSFTTFFTLSVSSRTGFSARSRR